MDLINELGFDLYGRCAVVKDIINDQRIVGDVFRILDVGGQDGLLAKFLPNDDVYFLNPNFESDDVKFIKADGCDLPFENDSFDWVISTDVFEHIVPEKRLKFLSESFRVAKQGMVLAAPFDDIVVANAEKNINNKFRELFGIEHPWLIEHIQNGLPSLDTVLDFADAMKVDYQIFHNNDVSLWEMGYNLLLQREVNPEIDIRLFTQTYNQNYQLELSNNNSYRKIIVLHKQKTQIKHNDVLAVDFGVFRQKITNLIHQEYVKVIHNQKNNIDELRSRQVVINEQISTLYSQLYISNGGLFSEVQSLQIPISIGPQYLCYDISSFDGSVFFRFDPSNVECSVKIDSIELQYADGVEYIDVSSSNACFVDNNVYYFNTNDSNFFFSTDLNRKIIKIIFRCNYLNFDKVSFKILIDVLKDKVKNNFIDITDLHEMEKRLTNEFFKIHSIVEKNNAVFLAFQEQSFRICEITDNSRKTVIKLSNEIFDKIAELNKSLLINNDEILAATHVIFQSTEAMRGELKDNLSVLNNKMETVSSILSERIISEVDNSKVELSNLLISIQNELQSDGIVNDTILSSLNEFRKSNELLVSDLTTKLIDRMDFLQKNISEGLTDVIQLTNKQLICMNEIQRNNLLKIDEVKDNLYHSLDVIKMKQEVVSDKVDLMKQLIIELLKQNNKQNQEMQLDIKTIIGFNENLLVSKQKEFYELQTKYMSLYIDANRNIISRIILKKHLN